MDIPLNWLEECGLHVETGRGHERRRAISRIA